MAKRVVYQSVDSQWCWRLVARNGRIVADGSETYTRRADCVKASARAQQLMATADLEILEWKKESR